MLLIRRIFCGMWFGSINRMWFWCKKLRWLEIKGICFLSSKWKVLVCSSQGDTRGVSSFWNKDIVQGELLLSRNNLLWIPLSHIRNKFTWILSNVYALSFKVSRLVFWERLVAFTHFDFNTTLWENIDGFWSHSQLKCRLDSMRSIDSQALMDVELQGLKYTWLNHRSSDDFLKR